MAGVVVCGGGVCGLAAAMLLARDGHEVTVLERDPAPAPVPEEAWDDWERRGVNQFRLPHFLLPRFHDVAIVELPDVVARLDAAGAYRFNMVTAMSGGAFPPDPRLDVVTARRPVLEAVVAGAAEATPGITIRRGVAGRGLLSGASVVAGIPHVVGVETEDGERIAADVVIDATGRRSPLPRWLAAIGTKPPLEELEDSGIVYYGRHVRSRDGTPVVAGPSNNRFGSISLLALPAEHGTAGVGVIASSKDVALRVLRHEDAWRRVVELLPGGAPILDAEPVSPMASMSKLENRRRRYVVDGAPVATGVVAVADSWAATNPSLGRGISLGLMHAVALRDSIRKEGLDRALDLALAFDDVTEREFTPWYASTVGLDRHSVTLIDAAIDDRPVDWDADPVWRDWARVLAAIGTDPITLVPRFAGSFALLAELPEHLVGDPDIQDLLERSGAEPVVLAGPSRAEVLAAATG
jgi:2-polyprenyl-6-methoxyphenol hydroxylase-like FAD-dependent oxidoreductase